MALINYITPIQFDAGAIAELPAEMERVGITRPLVVTDKGIASTPILETVTSRIGGNGMTLYDGTDENPSEGNLEDALGLYKEAGCDGIIAVGGGSPMDLAKAVALLATQGGNFSDYEVKTGGSAAIKRVLPHIAIPTAAGTGAEIGRACVLTTKDGRKSVAVNLNMVAHSIICDPELTLSLPPYMTAATGMDALSHGLETFVSRSFNPPAGAIALDCIERAACNIVEATENGENMEARRDMLMAALEGGMVLQKGLGSAHAMANPLGELHLHHGTLIALLLPHVLAFNHDAAGERYDVIRSRLGLAPKTDLAAWCHDLVVRLKLPTTLKELGVDRAALPEMAAKAEKDHLSATNPRKASEADYLKLLEDAYGD